ncbi:MAG: hypothetical protein MZW92_16820 [Comamonadaceae bacterium]|nr:hypothetical protein [Comamonadaceae bacterium]
MATSETREPGTACPAEILKDVALTNKLLRMVNTAHFTAGRRRRHQHGLARRGAGGLRRHPQHGAVACCCWSTCTTRRTRAQLKEEFLRALMAGHAGRRAVAAAARSRGGLHRRDVPEPRPAAHRVLLPRGGAADPQLVADGSTPAARPMRRPTAARCSVLGTELRGTGPGRRARAGACPTRCSACMRRPRRRAAGARCSRRGAERLRWPGASPPTRSTDTAAARRARLRPRSWHRWPKRHARGARPARRRRCRRRADSARAAPGDRLAAGDATCGVRRRLAGAARWLATAVAAAPAAEADTLADAQRCRPRDSRPWRGHALDGRAPSAPRDSARRAARPGIAGHHQLDGRRASSSTKCCAWCSRPCSARWRFRRVVFCLRDPKHRDADRALRPGRRRRRRWPRVQGAAARAAPICSRAVCAKGADTLISRRDGGQHRRAPAALVPQRCARTGLPAAAADAQGRAVRADLRRQGAARRHRAGREGAVPAAHAAQPGGDGVQAGELTHHDNGQGDEPYDS